MTRLGLLCGSLLLVAACTGGTPPPSATSIATPTAPVPPLAPTPSARPTPTPVHPGFGVCPTSSPLTALELVESDPACFGSADIEIRAWLGDPPAMDFSGPGVEPRWLFAPAVNVDRDRLATLWEARPAGEFQDCSIDGRGCAWSFVWVNPAAGLTIGGPPRWLIATGHLQDPAAETCHYVYPEDWVEPHEDDTLAVASCRQHLVVVAIRDAP